jgi:hypothetical protein
MGIERVHKQRYKMRPRTAVGNDTIIMAEIILKTETLIWRALELLYAHQYDRELANLPVLQLQPEII